MQKLWEIEDVPLEKKRTIEEELCEEIIVTQHSRDENGRYIVRMPFNKEKKPRKVERNGIATNSMRWKNA